MPPLSAIEAKQELEWAQGVQSAPFFMDDLTLSSPNSAARYLVLVSLLTDRQRGWRPLLSRESPRFEVAPNQTDHSTESLASEVQRLRPWLNELVSASNLGNAEWRLDCSAWGPELSEDDPRRGFIGDARDADMVIRSGARLALAEGDLRNVAALTRASVRFVMHRLEWNRCHWLWAVANAVSLQSVAEESVLVVEAMMKTSSDRASVQLLARELRDAFEMTIADPTLDFRSLYVEESMARMERVRMWLSHEVPEPILEVSLDALAPTLIMRSKHAVDSWRSLELDHAAAVLASGDDPNERGEPPRVAVLCSDDAQDAISLSERAIADIAAAWNSPNGLAELQRIEDMIAREPTWIARFAIPWPRRLCATERSVRRTVQQSIDRLTDIANR